MRIEGICINTDGGYLDGSIRRLEDSLAYAQACGFDGVELSLAGLDLVVGGRANGRQVDRVLEAIRGYDGTITAHAPDRLNLAHPQSIPGCPPELSLEMDVFRACLEVCPILRPEEGYRERCRRRIDALGLEDEVCGICVRVCWEANQQISKS